MRRLRHVQKSRRELLESKLAIIVKVPIAKERRRNVMRQIRAIGRDDRFLNAFSETRCKITID